MRYTLLLVLALGACGTLPPEHYDGRYSGIAKEDKCNRTSAITAVVYNGRFNLYVYSYRINGTVDADGYLQGASVGDNPTVTFKGHISRPLFGNLFSGTVTDGRCDPYVELSPPATQ
jgi:hypothetical protein